MTMCEHIRIRILTAAGLFFAICGLISYIAFPYLMRWQVEQNFILAPGARPYQYWKEVPVPIYVSYYFFNVTNPEEIIDHEAKPILEEVGPYVYRETREKINITWNENGTVSYKQIRRWFFQPHKTPGRLDDVITTLNVPMVSSAYTVRHMEDFYKYIVQEMMPETNNTLFVQRQIRELLFDGRYELLLAVAQKMEEFHVPYDHFGWFYMKNNTEDGLYTIFTGEKGMDNYGEIDRWNGRQEVPNVWRKPCNDVNGTAGDMWPPYKNFDRDNLTIFVSDICRSLYLNYNRDVEVKGIKARRYIADHTLFDNGHYNTLNKCFCDEDSCLPRGVLNISACQMGAPALVSYPHFLYADHVYGDGVVGLRPNVDKHSFFMDLEPELGIPINVAAKTQVNIIVQPIEDVKPFSEMTKTTVYPIFWTSQTAEVNEDMVKLLLMVLDEVPQYATIGSFLMIAIGGIILISTVAYAIRIRKAKRKMTYTAVKQSVEKQQLELL